jgi:peptidoglycan/xylan/chitin deacetylase (PgdA/CDA1 family)
MNTWSKVAALTAALLMAGGTASATPLSSAVSKPSTVVSLTFDDGFKTQLEAARELGKRGMSGTFYVNSGSLTYPAYMSADDIKEVSRLGNEIGGHTVNHAHLAAIAPAQAKAEICSDRDALSSLVGFPLRSFAYPYGDVNNSVVQLVKACGYNSARAVSGLRNGPSQCSDCPPAETVPPQDPYNVRTNQSVEKDDTFEDLTKRVTAAELKGGWLPLTFHRICDGCAQESTSMQTLVRLLDWLGTRPSTTTVRTMGQVIGGPAKPAKSVPAGAVGKFPDATAPNNPGPSSSNATFHVLGYGVGQAQIVGGCVGLGVVLALVYRVISRKHRYRGGSA